MDPASLVVHENRTKEGDVGFTVRWEIRNFDARLFSSITSVNSPIFYANGYKWKLLLDCGSLPEWIGMFLKCIGPEWQEEGDETPWSTTCKSEFMLVHQDTWAHRSIYKIPKTGDTFQVTPEEKIMTWGRPHLVRKTDEGIQPGGVWVRNGSFILGVRLLYPEDALVAPTPGPLTQPLVLCPKEGLVHLPSLRNVRRTLLWKREFPDTELYPGGNSQSAPIFAHALLLARCEAVKKMLHRVERYEEDGIQWRCIVPDTTATSLQYAIQHLYTGIVTPKIKFIPKVVWLAHSWGLVNLVDNCRQVLWRATEEDALDVVRVMKEFWVEEEKGLLAPEASVLNACFRYVLRFRAHVVSLVEYKEMLIAHPSLAVRVSVWMDPEDRNKEKTEHALAKEGGEEVIEYLRHQWEGLNALVTEEVRDNVSQGKKHEYSQSPMESSKRRKGEHGIVNTPSSSLWPHDVVLIAGVDKTRFYAHRCILATRSAYFAQLLCGQWKERNQQEIILVDRTKDELRAVLEFLYCDRCSLPEAVEIAPGFLCGPDVSPCSLLVAMGQILSVANFLQIPEMEEEAWRRMSLLLSHPWGIADPSTPVTIADLAFVLGNKAMCDTAIGSIHALPKDKVGPLLRELSPLLLAEIVERLMNQSRWMPCGQADVVLASDVKLRTDDVEEGKEII